MVEHGQGPRSGARDNGLRCAGYVPVGDLDPRVADALLERLRDEGIAAYVAPTPGHRGGALEVTMPSRLTDRLYADSEHAARAWELLAATPLTDPRSRQPHRRGSPSRRSTSSPRGNSCSDRCSQGRAPRHRSGRPARASTP